jgi:hypothetical protein
MAKALKVKANPLQKLVDELGEIHEQRKALSEREEMLKAELKRHGAGVFDGLLYCAMSEERQRTFYKTELLKINVDEATLEKCKVMSAYLEIKLQRRTPLRIVKST